MRMVAPELMTTVHICDSSTNGSPVPPPLCGPATNNPSSGGLVTNGPKLRGCSSVSTVTRDMWERLFDEGYKTDVTINTEHGGVIHAHAIVIGMASPVIRGMIKQSKTRANQRSISVRGVSHDAVRVFIRFLYSSCYEKDDMEEFVLQLLVLSHVFRVPELKRVCVHQLEHGLLTTENVIDIFQLALLCDAPRLSLICHHTIMKNLEAVASTEGWKAMKESHPVLEKELFKSMIQEDRTRRERIRKMKERKVYLELYEAMEALVHICRDGCRTIGPSDKDFKEDQPPCKYAACKGLELLVRHFAGCKLRVPGGCMHCKRMWQLLELHSRLCTNSDACRVPLCSNFKQKVKKQSKKDGVKWKKLARKILMTKRVAGAPSFSSAIPAVSWKTT